MGLGWKGPTASQVADSFMVSTARTRRDAKARMREFAKKVLEDSKTMAPVDDGELEKAHHLETIRLNQDEIALEISVGGTVNGVNVDEYAMVQHERLTPAGDLQLGPKSAAKNASNPPEKPVGGKFLERAADMAEPLMLEDIAQALRPEEW